MARGDAVGSVYAFVGGEGCPQREVFSGDGLEQGAALKAMVDTDDLPVQGGEVVHGLIWNSTRGFRNRITDCGSCAVGATVCPQRYTIEQIGVEADRSNIIHLPASAVIEEIGRENRGEYGQPPKDH